MITIEALRTFNTQNSDVFLWTFKKQNPRGESPRFNGHWVALTDEMKDKLRLIVSDNISAITELQEYGLLAQNNEQSALTISAAETHVGLVREAFGAELPNRKVRDVKTLLNSAFYTIKLVHDGSVLYAVKKTDTSWRSKSVANVLTAFFSDMQLDVAADDNFRIMKTIDFFGLEDDLAISHKANFESVLNYRAAHERDYAEMSVEQDFLSVFDDLAALTEFVGTNKIHLRRMSAIRQKGFYADEAFMKNLRNHHAKYGLNIEFDSNGKIVPTPETARDIIAALLDHRLSSAFSGHIYDVPDATPV